MSATTGAGRRRKRVRRPATEFYAGALDEADRVRLSEAATVQGLDQEIALLRLRLHRVLSERPDDFALAVRAIELLVRAVSAAGKLSPAQHHDVLEQLSAEVGGLLSLLADE